MSAPDYYVEYLLGKAAAACDAVGGSFGAYPSTVHRGRWTVVGAGKTHVGHPTLEAALTALLDDLGVDVEPRPSAEEVREARRALPVYGNDGLLCGSDAIDLHGLRDLYASGDRGRLLASAVIAGGEGS